MVGVSRRHRHQRSESEVGVLVGEARKPASMHIEATHTSVLSVAPESGHDALFGDATETPWQNYFIQGI